MNDILKLILVLYLFSNLVGFVSTWVFSHHFFSQIFDLTSVQSIALLWSLFWIATGFCLCAYFTCKMKLKIKVEHRQTIDIGLKAMGITLVLLFIQSYFQINK